MIKAILFDFGGVIMDLKRKPTTNIASSLSELFNIPTDNAKDLWRDNREDLITGKESPKDFLKKLKQILGSDKSVDELFKKWRELQKKEPELINWDLLGLVTKLKKHYQVYIFSDAIDVAQDDQLTADIKSKFDGSFFSYKEGSPKSDKRAFFNVLNKIKLLPEEVVYIDDSTMDIAVAESIGIKSIKYNSLQNLRSELEKAGVVE
jgi:glucose-1-phosphatase